MSDILNQNEVDALLAAVDKGNVEVELEVPETHRKGVSVYDFKRPERVSKDQLRALTALHESFARNVSANLSSTMRTVVEVTVASVEQLTYSEFILSLPNPTGLAVLSASPLEGRMILEVNPAIVYPILDRMLGGGQSEVVIPDRPMTDIEQRLTTKVVSQNLPLLSEMWSNIKKITFAVVDTETNPQLVQLVPPHEAVILVTFQITMGEHSGMMNLCIPFTVIEPIMGQFSTQNWFAVTRKAPDQANVVLMTRSLSQASLETVAELARTTITVRELLGLEVGDVIKTEQASDGEVTLYVEGKPKFLGRPGRVRRNKAVEVTRPVPPGKNE